MSVPDEFQRIIDNSFYEDVEFDPEFVRQLDVDNHVKRVFAHLFALYGGRAIRLRCQADGTLLVSSAAAAAFLPASRTEYAVSNTPIGPYSVGSEVSRVSFFAENADVYVDINVPSTGDTYYVFCPVGQFITIPLNDFEWTAKTKDLGAVGYLMVVTETT